MAFLKQVPEKKRRKYFRNNVKEWKANIIQMYVCIYFAIPSVSSKIKFAGYKWFSLSSPQHNQTDLLKFCYTADNFFFQLKREFGGLSMPPFPPKKFLSLTPAKVEERRQLLERFIQIGKIQREVHTDLQDPRDVYRDW